MANAPVGVLMLTPLFLEILPPMKRMTPLLKLAVILPSVGMRIVDVFHRSPNPNRDLR